jgi:hypothetical protein
MIRTVGLASVVLVVALGSSGCGSSGGSRSSTRDRAIASYTVGLQQWGRRMTGALDGLSVLFSTPDDIRRIEAAERTAEAKVARFEQTLASCGVVLGRLGLPPAVLVTARGHALRACANLEKAATLVRRGVRDVQSGLGYEHFGEATTPLSDGQADVSLVLAELRLRPASF